MLIYIFLIPVFYYAYYISKHIFAFIYYSPERTENREKVSVIVPFRNEAGNLLPLLRSLQKQTAKNYEVIFVDDNSEDAGAELLKKNITEPHFKVLQLPSDKQGKKQAISLGISQSTGTIILTTDADCVVPENWIETMRSYFTEDTAMVLGPVRIVPEGNLLRKLLSLELSGLIILSAGAIALNSPNLANGANLAYRKYVFEEINGFAGIDNVASGDDELLLQKVLKHTSYKIVYAKSPEAFVETKPPTNIKELSKQRTRWTSKTKLYPPGLKFKLLLIMFSYLVLFLLPFWDIDLFLLALVIKTVSDFSLSFTGTKFAMLRIPVFYWIIMEFLYTFFVVFIGIKTFFVKEFTWKGRRVR